MKKKLKVLVFGSNGMVGSSLLQILKKSNKVESVIGSSRKDTNLFDLEATKCIIQSSNPDVIINAAAKVGGIVANNTQRTEFIMENLKINMNILEACIPSNNLKIINLGSSCIYPLHAENPINEKSFMTGTLEPTNSPYALAKIAAIEIGRSISAQYGHRILNLMPTNLYGPNDYFSIKNSHVIPGLIYRMHNAKQSNDESFEVWGTGKPLREFLHVDDLASSVEFLLDKNLEIDLLNVGSSCEISIKELANMIKDIVGFKGDVLFDKTKPDGNPRKLLDSGKINSLGWTSTITLEEGLSKTYNWFVSNYSSIRI